MIIIENNMKIWKRNENNKWHNIKMMPLINIMKWIIMNQCAWEIIA